jgi:hypothetical protein
LCNNAVPARRIKFRFDSETIKRLKNIAWWNYDPKSLSMIRFDDINVALDEIEKRKDNGLLVNLRTKKYIFENEELFEV